MKWLIAFFWIVSVVIAYNAGSLLGSLDSSFKPVTTSEPVIVHGRTKAYIKKYSWGLLGQHSMIYLTKEPNRERPDEAKDMAFRNVETLFFEASGDTLKIYSNNPLEIKPGFSSGLIIEYVELKNPAFMQLYDRYHSQLKCTDWM